MGIFWCTLLLAFQILQLPGVVTGVVRSKDGVPAAGVRVYVIPAPEAGDVARGVVLESITQTDNSGRYRLEARPGRYYLAAGSVQAPNYYPGDADIRSARVIDIVSGTTLPADFSSFSPAAPPVDATFIDTLAAAFAAGFGQISGTVRYANGSPVSGNTVVAVIANAPPAASAARFRTTTDSFGRYRFTSLLPGSYHLATGYAERPVFFPGVRSLAEAAVVNVTASKKIDADFVVPQSVPGVTVRGKVSSTAGLAIEDADVRLVSRNNSGVPVSLPQRPLTRAYSLHDGSFALQDILPGKYDLEVRVSGITPVVRKLDVVNESLDGIDVNVPMALISGRIVMDDGSVVPDIQSIGPLIATTSGNPNLLSRVTFSIDDAGEFSRLIEPGRFRVSLENVPEGYAVSSIESAGQDLQSGFEVTESTALRIEVHLVRKP